MRIRGKSSASSVSLSPLYSSPAASASSSPPSSSSSSITINSSLSSQDSSNSCPFSSTSIPTNRCHGLDLLVKAIRQVTAGSVVGYPYIQRRVMIRRRRRRELKLDGFKITELELEPNGKKKKMNNKKGKSVTKRATGLSTKYQDSVIQSWKPTSRRGRSAIADETETETGL